MEEARLAPGQEEAAQNGAEGTWGQGEAGIGGDRLGSRLGLLGCDSALLHGKRRDVAGRIDVLHSRHAPVRVDRNESLERLRDAGDSRALQPRERHDPVGREDLVADQQQLAGSRFGGMDAGVQADAPSGEDRRDRVARLSPEQLERGDLGSDDRELDAGDLALGDPRRRHERELVRRKAPDGTGGDGEEDMAHRAGLDLAQELGDDRRVRRSAEGERAAHARRRPRADGDEQRRIGDGPSRRRVREVACGIDRDELAEREGRAQLLREISEVEMADVAEAERLRDRERPVPELRLGGEQLDADAPLRELPERERRLERCDASSRDEHVPGSSVIIVPPPFQCTTRTSQCALRATPPLTLSPSSRASQLGSRVPTTIRSAPRCSASSAISAAGSPIPTT